MTNYDACERGLAGLGFSEKQKQHYYRGFAQKVSEYCDLLAVTNQESSSGKSFESTKRINELLGLPRDQQAPEQEQTFDEDGDHLKIVS